MALHPDFPESPHAILDPEARWFPADEALRETTMDKLMPPLVAQLRRKVKEFRDSGYVGASDTSKSLLNWWFKAPHLLPNADGNMFGKTWMCRRKWNVWGNGARMSTERSRKSDMILPLWTMLVSRTTAPRLSPIF